MKFDNAQFTQGISSTLSALDKLKASMNLGNAGSMATKSLGLVSGALSKFGLTNPFSKLTGYFTGFASKFISFGSKNHLAPAQAGITELQKSANGFTMQGLEGSVTGVSKSFIAMSTIAITALSNIVNKAVDAGLSMAKSLTVQPISAGLKEYETNLNSIQTILANTKASGANLQDVNKALDELNRYSDTTIYNFSEMAKNIGTFTAAGVGLDESVRSIKGIANLAALSGSNSQQAATAMYQLSQEIAAGRVSLMGWNSVVNAGMGGSTFQRALAQTAVAMGEIPASAVKLEGAMKNVTVEGVSFRDSIMAKPGEQSWLTKEVLTGTLAQFTGDMSKAQIMAQGFSESQAQSIMATARTAQAAAQDVKTLSGVFDVAAETAGSGWSRTWQLIFGDFKEAKTLFTNFSQAFSGMIADAADKRNNLLEGWDKLGGREVLIDAITIGLKALLDILKPIKLAFRDIFPATTAKELFNMTLGFADLMVSLKPTGDTVMALRSTFRGLFAILSIIGQVIGGVASMFGRLFAEIGKGGGGFLKFTGGIGDTLTAFDAMLKKSGLIEGFFIGIGDILAVPLRLIQNFAAAIAEMFSGFDGGAANGISKSIDGVTDRLSPLASLGEKIKVIFAGLGRFLSTLANGIVDALSQIGSSIAGAFTGDVFGRVLETINTGLFAGMLLLLKKFVTDGLNFGFKGEIGGGFLDQVKDTLGAVTDALTTMQANLKANILLKIAAAVGILALSLLLLASIDPKRLAMALGAMVVGFGAMGLVLNTLAGALSIIGAAKLPIIAGAMVLLAGSILILSVALKIMASIEFGDMLRGLTGLAILLFIMNKAVGALSANSGPMLRASVSLIAIGIALNILALALKQFAGMSWGEMAKGLAGVAGSLIVLSAGMRLMPKGIVLQAVGITILAVALNALAIAVKQFGNMDLKEMAKGLYGIGGTLVVIGMAMRLMPATLPITAASLLLVSGALVVMASALKIISTMSWEDVTKGLVTVAGMLVILAAGLNAMTFALLGAAALTVAVAALWLLAPVLVTLGAMSWEAIVKGLVAVAGTFLVLGVAGLLLAPVSPIILALGAALLMLGAGMFLAGAGAIMMASAVRIFIGAITTGGKAVGQFVKEIIKQIPAAMKAFGRGIVGMVTIIAKAGPQMVRAFSAILSSFLKSVIKNVPLMGKAFLTMLNTALKVIVSATPRIVNAGFTLIIRFLQAISKNIGKMTGLAADIIVKFLNGIAKNIGRIIQSGVNLIIKFIDGMSNAIDRNSGRMGAAGGRLAVAIVRGMASGIWNGIGVIKDAALGVAHAALDTAKDFLGIHSPSREFAKIGMFSSLGMAEGISTYSKVVNKSAENVGKSALKTMKATMSGMAFDAPGGMDLQPTITPVLDLSNVRREAVKMGGLLATDKLRAGVSYDSARGISRVTDKATDISTQSPVTPIVKEIKFEQNIHSPKAISPTEVYRNTKNQLNLAKEALEKS